jgi:hypothetical protein
MNNNNVVQVINIVGKVKVKVIVDHSSSSLILTPKQIQKERDRLLKKIEHIHAG